MVTKSLSPYIRNALWQEVFINPPMVWELSKYYSLCWRVWMYEKSEVSAAISNAASKGQLLVTPNWSFLWRESIVLAHVDHSATIIIEICARVTQRWLRPWRGYIKRIFLLSLFPLQFTYLCLPQRISFSYWWRVSSPLSLGPNLLPFH